MQGDISRIMVEIAVRQALKNRSKQSFRRSLRTLVEYGEHFSSGPFQSRFFILVQQMLRERIIPITCWPNVPGHRWTSATWSTFA